MTTPTTNEATFQGFLSDFDGLAAALNAARANVLIADLEFNIIYANPASVETLLTFEDAAGATTYRMDLEDDTEALVLDSPVAPTPTYTLDPATGEIPFESPDGQTTYNLQT